MADMSAASAALSYERAGWLRDRLAALQHLEAQLTRVREAFTKPTCVYVVRGVQNERWLYLLKDGRVAAEANADDNIAVTRLEALQQLPSSAPNISPHADQLDELLMIDQWFRTRPGEQAFTAPTVRQALQLLLVPVFPAG